MLTASLRTASAAKGYFRSFKKQEQKQPQQEEKDKRRQDKELKKPGKQPEKKPPDSKLPGEMNGAQEKPTTVKSPSPAGARVTHCGAGGAPHLSKEPLDISRAGACPPARATTGGASPNPQPADSPEIAKASLDTADKLDSGISRKYYQTTRARWQGKLGKECFPSGDFRYEDFLKVIDENDHFRTFDLKFSVSKDIARHTGGTGLKKLVREVIQKVVDQVQRDVKIKFKRETRKKNVRVEFKTHQKGRMQAIVESHIVSIQNAPLTRKALEDPKYRQLFQDTLNEKLQKKGIAVNGVDIDMRFEEKECPVCLDVPCQPPKSVSLTMMFPEHFDNILQCHENANQAAMQFIENNYIMARSQVSRISRKNLTHNMLSAGFTELTNRSLHPHLHDHNIIFNTTRNPFFTGNPAKAKEFLSIDFKVILDNMPVIDTIYKNSLIEELKKAGYRLEHDKDNRLNFEIKGFTREQIEHFSRIGEINRKLEEMGTDRANSTAQQRNLANLLTRKAKVQVDEEQWKRELLDEMIAMGITSPRLAHQLDTGSIDRTQETGDCTALSTAADAFLYGNAAFTKHEFMKGVLETAGDVVTAREVELYFDESRRFIRLGENKRDGKVYFSTLKNIEVEYAIYRYARQGKDQRTHSIKESKVNRFLKNTRLNPGQKAAVRFMATCPDRVIAIQGHPGVGKSFMLEQARQMYETSGYRVVGLAPSNQAVASLSEKSGMQATTIHSFFIRLQEASGTWEEGRDPLDLRLTDFSRLAPQGERVVWIVDEASLIDNYTMNRLLEAAERTHANVVLIGDRNQLPPVEAGRPFAAMLKDQMIANVEMKELMRQKEVWIVFDAGKLSSRVKGSIEKMGRRENALVSFVEGPVFDSIDPGELETLRLRLGKEVTVFKDRAVKDAVKLAVDGKLADSLKLLERKIVEVKSRKTRLQEIASHYASLSPLEREQTAIITATNKDRIELNALVRETLKARGELPDGRILEVTGRDGEKHPVEFAVGDKIVFHRKGYLPGLRYCIKKNDTGFIRKIEEKVFMSVGEEGFKRENNIYLTVASNGRVITFATGEHDHFDHGHCSTTYKEQSAGYKNVLSNFDTSQYLVNSRNDALVKLSRAMGDVTIFTDDRRGLYDAIKNEHHKVCINDFKDEEFTIHEVPALAFADKEKFIDHIASRIEYENAAFCRGDYFKDAMMIYAELDRAGEAPFYLTEADFLTYFEKKYRSEHYQAVGFKGGATYFSTQQNIDMEWEIYDLLSPENNRMPHQGMKQEKIQAYLEKSSLNNQQQEAIRFMTSSDKRVKAIHCAPGTGKTFLLDATGSFYRDTGDYRVIALAPSNRAVSNIKTYTSIDQAYTIHSYLVRLQKEAQTWEPNRDPLDLRLVNLDGLTPGSHKEIWLVDKASLLDNHLFHKILTAAKLKEAEVVFFGHEKQMLPVGPGKPFRDLIRGGNIEYFELNERMRPPEKVEKLQLEPGMEVEIFRDQGLHEAVELALQDDIAASLERLKDHIHQEKDDEQRLQQLAGAYTSLPPAERSRSILITGTNRDRLRINRMVRENLKARGELDPGHLFAVADKKGNVRGNDRRRHLCGRVWPRLRHDNRGQRGGHRFRGIEP